MNAREREIIYYSLSRQLDEGGMSEKEFNELVNLRQKVKKYL